MPLAHHVLITTIIAFTQMEFITLPRRNLIILIMATATQTQTTTIMVIPTRAQASTTILSILTTAQVTLTSLILGSLIVRPKFHRVQARRVLLPLNTLRTMVIMLDLI